MQIWILYLHRNRLIRDQGGNLLCKSGSPLCLRHSTVLVPTRSYISMVCKLFTGIKIFLLFAPQIGDTYCIRLVALTFCSQVQCNTCFFIRERQEGQSQREREKNEGENTEVWESPRNLKMLYYWLRIEKKELWAKECKCLLEVGKDKDVDWPLRSPDRIPPC